MLGLVNLLASGVDNSTIDGLWTTIKGIVDGTIIPVLYAVLGLFLVVKGALLGVQIVKAADEPQVRQEKIGSLKWLVIGVAIAFGVVIAADVLMGYFSSTFGQTVFNGTGGSTSAS